MKKITIDTDWYFDRIIELTKTLGLRDALIQAQQEMKEREKVEKKIQEEIEKEFK